MLCCRNVNARRFERRSWCVPGLNWKGPCSMGQLKHARVSPVLCMVMEVRKKGGPKLSGNPIRQSSQFQHPPTTQANSTCITSCGDAHGGPCFHAMMGLHICPRRPPVMLAKSKLDCTADWRTATTSLAAPAATVSQLTPSPSQASEAIGGRWWKGGSCCGGCCVEAGLLRASADMFPGPDCFPQWPH